MRELQRAAADTTNSMPIVVEPLSFSQVSTSYLGGAKSKFEIVPGEDWNDMPGRSAVLVRTMPIGSLEQTIFRMNALHVALANGVSVFNPPRSLEIAIDKWLTLETVRQAGLPIPRTLCCQSRHEAMQAWHDLFDEDCVVKPIFGGEGRGIMRITDADLAWRVFSALEQTGAVLYLQEFLTHCGFDLRLLIIDDAVFCVRRENASDWRTNAGRGGRFLAHEPSFEQVNLAFRASKAVGTWMAGVDILTTQDGRDVVLEVNAVPGWRATASALNVDISRLVLERIVTYPG